MLKKMKTAVGEIIRGVSALYLGFGLSDLLVKSVAPTAWEAPAALATGGAFYFVLRWLGEKSPQLGHVPTTQSPRTSNAPARKASRCGKRDILPPIAFKRSNFPSWLSSARNRVFAANDERSKPCALPFTMLRH